MATRTAPKKANGPRGWRSLTLSVGLVNVPVQIGPLNETKKSGGTYLCVEHRQSVKQAWYCECGEHHIPRSDCVTAYEVDGSYVDVDASQLKVQGDGQVALEACVDFASIDPVYLQSTYLIWPQAGAERGFDLLAEALRASGSALVGTVCLTSTTRAFVIRWSEATGTLVAHVCGYDAAIRWESVELISAAAADRAQPAPAELTMAEQLLKSIAGAFEPDKYHDEYAEKLAEAIAAAAAGTPVKQAEPDAEVKPTADLMAALQASIAGVKAPAKAKAKTNGKAKPRKKVAA